VLTAFEAFAGTFRANQLSESVLVQWRDRLEQNARLTSRGINRKVALLLSVLKWARARGLITREVWSDCSVIEPLKRGECGSRPERARERRAVTLEEIDKVAAACTCRHIAAMVRVQAMVGCRPGELCAVRWMDIDRTPVVVDGVTLWTYRVAQSVAKTAHHGRSISYPIPPRAQAILAEFPAFPNARVFSPAQSMAERGRSRKTAPAFGPKWTARAYRNAVVTSTPFSYACPLTEAVLLGTVAGHFRGEKLHWDTDKMEFDNYLATALVQRIYRKGWQLWQARARRGSAGTRLATEPTCRRYQLVLLPRFARCSPCVRACSASCPARTPLRSGTPRFAPACCGGMKRLARMFVLW